MKQTPILFLDIDGTVRQIPRGGSIKIFPGISERLQSYKKKGWRIVGISNQGGIALGNTTERNVRQGMIETNRQCGEAFNFIYVCPHHPSARSLSARNCTCRKPKIGGIIRAKQALQRAFPEECYPNQLALFVGDMLKDRECARNAGIRFIDAVTWRGDTNSI